MGLLSSQVVSTAHAPEQAGRALESLLVQKLIQSSGAFKGSGEAGSQLHNDLFVETLADAVANGPGKLGKPGGLGLAETLKNELARPMNSPPAGPTAQAPGGPSPGSHLEAALDQAPSPPLPDRRPSLLASLLASPLASALQKKALIAYGRRAEESGGRKR